MLLGRHRFCTGLMPSLKSWQPDLFLNGYNNALVLEQHTKDVILDISGVDRAFGTAYLDHIPATSSRPGIDYINLESYDENLLKNAEDEVVRESAGYLRRQQ